MKKILFFLLAYLVSSKETELEYTINDKVFKITKDNID